jgi:hypothetical protein
MRSKQRNKSKIKYFPFSLGAGYVRHAFSVRAYEVAEYNKNKE